MSTTSIVKAMIDGTAEHVSGDQLAVNALVASAPPVNGIPTSLSQLIHGITRVYDLTVTGAVSLNIPVIGGVSGEFDRRVIVLERTAYKIITHDDIEYWYGYAIRLIITVNKITADMKLTLPFMAASAELGRVEGKWTLHVAGLAGAAIDAAIMPPKALSVETFVLASQSLEALIKAVRVTGTTFTAVKVGVKKPADVVEREYRIAVGRSYALGRIHEGRKLSEALNDLDTYDDILKDTITDTYKEFAGITSNNVKPKASVRNKAGTILGPVVVEPD